MTWNNPLIIGTRSVAQNKTPLNQNNSYIESIMQVDHYWAGDPDGVTSDHDGHHQWVQMPKIAATPFVLATGDGMDGGYFTEEITKQDTTPENLPFFVNSDGHKALLGTRACINFSVANVAGTITPSIEYAHNVSTIGRVSAGIYSITFATPLPTANYVVTAIGYIPGNFILTQINPNVSYAVAVTTTQCQVLFYKSTNNNIATDPVRGMIQIVGG